MNLDVSRKENKYILTYKQAERLYQKLKQILPGDDKNGYEPYQVRSLYFDSYYNDDYFDKMDGVENRKKIRIRIYSRTDETAKLELKQKSGSNQRKRSVSITKQEAIRLAAGDYSLLLEKENKLAEELYYIMTKELYRPKCIVEYQRRAFAVPTNNIRITFDSDIVSSEGSMDLYGPACRTIPVEMKNRVILEVKYNHFLLSYIKDALESCNESQEAYSKYIVARKYGLS